MAANMPRKTRRTRIAGLVETLAVTAAFSAALVTPLVGSAQDAAETPMEASEGEAVPAPAEPAPAAEPQPMEQPSGPGELMEDVPDTGATAQAPDTYTIQSGDTLWDICARLLGDPFFWPKLWTFNQYITNPHWIYPGNLLSFREGTETQPPQFEVTKPDAVASGPTEATPTEATPMEATPSAQTEEVQEGFGMAPEAPQPQVAMVDPFPIANPRKDDSPFEVNLRQEGFIADEQLPAIGNVFKSEKPVKNLAENDEVYLRMNDSTQAQVGKRFTVYRTLRRVKHPKTKGYLGFLTKILAEIEVIALDKEGGAATARIVTSYDVINRGDPITEKVDVLRKVNLSPNTAALDGMIVESMVDDLTILGSGDVIYIDKGKEDGVQIGNTIDVIRTGDPLSRGSDAGLPNEVVGRMVIVGMRGRTSTAVIVDSFDALRIGDRVRMVNN